MQNTKNKRKRGWVGLFKKNIFCTHRPVENVNMGQPRPLFVYFRSFKTQILKKKLQTSAGFDLESSELKASTLTTCPPPRARSLKCLSFLFNQVELETAFSVVKCQDVESCPTPLTLSSLLSTHAMTSATTTTTPKATPTPMSTDAYFDPPVEFSTSPPVDAHRPRRSKSVTSITTSPLMTSPTAPMTMTSQATPTSMEFPDHKKFFGWTLRKSSTSYQSIN